MNRPFSEEPDESQDQFNLGTMLFIALAAIVGTTLTVWALHFMHLGTATVAASRPFPRIAVLPFHSLSANPDDIRSDHKLTEFGKQVANDRHGIGLSPAVVFVPVDDRIDALTARFNYVFRCFHFVSFPTS